MNPTHSTPGTDALDERLRRQSPAPNRPLRADFTQLVTTHISNNPHTPGLRHRIADVFRRPIIWLHTIPRVAAIAIIAIAIAGLSGAAYAAYEWIKPSATVTEITPQNDQGNRQFSVSALCGDFMNGKLKYEISPHAQISDQDAQKVFDNTCAYDATRQYINNKWPGDNDAHSSSQKKAGDITTLYNAENMFVGATDANPDFGLTTGTITKIDGSNVTIHALIYQTESVYNGKTSLPAATPISRTIALLPDYQVWQDGQQLAANSLNIGDQVEVVTRSQYKVQYYESSHGYGLGEKISFGAAAFIKTNLDLAYVMGQPFGNPAYTATMARLEPCNWSEDYLCLNLPNGAYNEIYSTHSENPRVPNDSKYLRADANDNNKIQWHQLDGRITAIQGTTITMQTRGKQDTATIHLPYDVVGSYNRRASTPHDGPDELPLAVGDTIEVYYGQAVGENRLDITSDDLSSIGLQLYSQNNKYYKY